VLTAKFLVFPIAVGDDREYVASPRRLMELAPTCLIELESGDDEARVFLKREPIFNDDGKNAGYIHYELRNPNLIYFSLEELQAIALKTGKSVLELSKHYPPPILLKDCVMVVLREDLERLIISNAKSEEKKPTQAETVNTESEKQLEFDKKCESFELWLLIDTDRESLTKGKIKEKLEAFNTIWCHGFTDWWKNQNYVKGNRGTKKLTWF
jgi:hypothetical protein